jgi:hypothetical protein
VIVAFGGNDRDAQRGERLSEREPLSHVRADQQQ